VKVVAPMEMGAGELNSAAAETYLAAFDCLDARVEGVVVRDRDAP
jgi:hypothetical protein